MAITRFTIAGGKLVSRIDLDRRSLDELLLAKARRALARLRNGRGTVTVRLPNGRDVTVGLGPAIPIPAEAFPEERRQGWEANRRAVEADFRRMLFYLLAPQGCDYYFLSIEGMEHNMTGAIVGSWAGERVANPASEPSDVPGPELIQRFIDVQRAIFAARPAFFCSGELTGAAAAFGDCFAALMLETGSEVPD